MGWRGLCAQSTPQARRGHAEWAHSAAEQSGQIVLGWPSGELAGEGCFLQPLLPTPPQPPWFPEAPSCALTLQACPQWTEMQSG